MESEHEFKEKDTALGAFREEIAGIAKKEAESGETADFSGIIFHPEELTEADMNIWGKIKDNKNALREFNMYKAAFDGVNSETRERFLYFVANKVTALIRSGE